MEPMRSFDELERLWAESPPPPRDRGTVRLICVRSASGVHECPERVRVSVAEGVEGDRWEGANDPERAAQVTLMNVRAAELCAADHAPLHLPGDNFLVDLDLGEDVLPPGTRLRLSAVVLEVSDVPHTGCATFRERFGADALKWVNYRANRTRRLRGMNCRVIADGEVAVGDTVEVVERT
jgi:MOSC domain-containing protein YiiM